MPKKAVLTTGEIAKYCNVNFRTVIRWIERGHMHSYKLPGRGDRRVAVDEFLRFLKNNTMPIPAELLLNKTRILIVENEIKMAKTIQRVLRLGGFETHIAQDGFMAGHLLYSFKPRIMLLDLTMPGIDGLSIIQFVRQQKNSAHLKILVMSANEIEAIQNTLAAGADDYLEKPVDNETLMQKIGKLNEHIPATIIT